MNGYEAEDLETLVEMLEYDESDESDESARRRRWGGRPRTATGRGMYSPRPQGNYVTQTQLQTALAKVGEQVRINSNAITTVTNRVNTVAADQTKQSAALRKETTDRRAETQALRRDLNNARQMSILPLLLQRPPELESVTISSAKDKANQPIAAAEGATATVSSAKFKSSSSDMMLPLVLMMGMGSGGDGGGAGGTDNSMMMMALVLSMRP